MPLVDREGGIIHTSHASKQSKISLKIIQAHTSVMLPLMAIPVFPFPITFKLAFVCVVILMLLERRGWTLILALKKIRSRLAGRIRQKNTRRTIERRIRLN